MYLQRQISAVCTEGEQEYLSNSQKFPYRLADVLPKYVLAIGNGEYTSDYIRLDATDSYVIPLPESYTSSDRLSVIIRSNAICRVVVISPDHGTSTFLLKATNGTTAGDHFGSIMWQGTVTSITVDVPTAFDPALVEYFAFKIPDLTEASSWRLGDRALGVVT